MDGGRHKLTLKQTFVAHAYYLLDVYVYEIRAVRSGAALFKGEGGVAPDTVIRTQSTGPNIFALRAEILSTAARLLFRAVRTLRLIRFQQDHFSPS